MNDTKSEAKFSHCIKCVEIFEADHEVCRKKAFNMLSLQGGRWCLNIMLLLTNCEVHTGKYLDRIFEVRTERSEVRTKN